ncbi:MAG: DNA-binding protein [Desulfuromonas sp.]|nr:MAG: DNA-binding protein [Desulfuromonas sp.]
MNAEVMIEKVMMFPDGRLDTKNASTYLGLSEKTLAMKRCDGTGPKFIKRGRIFYFKKHLDEWLESGQATSTAQIRHSR